MNINSIYDFSTLAPEVLGHTFKNMKLVSKLNFNTAKRISDVSTTYNNVSTRISGLPPIADLEFLVFENMDGAEIILATEYIEVNSIVEVENRDVVYTIRNMSSTQIQIVNNALKELGINDFEVV